MTATEEIHERTHDEDVVTPLRLAQKIVAVARAVGVVEKDSENGFHHYKYASIEAIVTACREELLNRGVLVLASVTDTADRARATREGESTVTTAHLTFTFWDAETDEKIELDWTGRGDDPADKGVSKALTDARKTFLIQQLNLARGDDTEADASTDQRSYGGNGGGTVNLVAEAKGLSDAKLNIALVAVGLPAQPKPFGAFTRIPAEHAEAVRAALQEQRGTP